MQSTYPPPNNHTITETYAGMVVKIEFNQSSNPNISERVKRLLLEAFDRNKEVQPGI